MGSVLEIDGLLESPLSDLHAIAGEIDIEGYRLLKKPDLTVAILESRGAVADEIRPAVEVRAAELERARAEREKALADAEEAAEAARDEARAAAAKDRARGGQESSGGRTRRGRTAGGDGGGRTRQPARDGRAKRDSGEATAAPRRAVREQKTEKPSEPSTPLAGVFEPGTGGGGRLRTEIARRVRGDADVPRAEVRKWNLRKGDLLQAQVRKSRRGRTDFVVSSIDSVNGLGQEERKAPATAFEEREAAPISGRYAKKTFKHAPVGQGSRVVVTGPTRAAASQMLRSLAGEMADAGVATTLVVVAARPEQTEAGAGVDVVAGDPGKPPESVMQALELALERGKRLAETGREVAVLIDGLDLLEPLAGAEIFNSARNLAQGGSLTIAAAAGSGSPLEAQATAIGVVAGGRRLRLDKKSSWAG